MLDANSSENQAARLDPSGAESLNARGGTVRPGLAGRVLVKREPGTRSSQGQTGTAVWQRTAVA